MKIQSILLRTILTVSVFAGSEAVGATYVVTYTGTVSTGQDITGVFGSVGSLSGDVFVSTYTYDLSRGQRQTTTGVSDEVIGGLAYGTTSPIINATLTINGTTVKFYPIVPAIGETTLADDSYAVTYSGYPSRTRYQIDASFLNYNTGYFSGATLINSSYQPSPLYLTQPFSSQVTDLSSGFSIGTGFIGTGPTYYANGNLESDTISVSAVPETATWTMMLLGLCTIGVAMRRAKHRLLEL